jgi:ABC-2 type transport system permease protein
MRIQALVTRIIRQFFRDKRTLAMIIVAPILILWLVSLVFAGDKFEPVIGLVNANDMIVNKFESMDIEVVQYDEQHKALNALLESDIHGYLDGNEIVVEGSDPAINNAVIFTIQKVLQTLSGAGNIPGKMPEITYHYGSPDMDTFDNIGPFFIGYFVFFFVFLIAGVSFLRERMSGTLEKLLSTPLKRWEIVIGYVIGFGIFTTIQSAIIVFFAIEVLDMMMFGSIWLVMLVTLTLSMTALTLGTLLSAFARNELQMIQFIPIVIIPQIFFSGLFNMDSFAPWLRGLSLVMPLTYGGEAMRDIMIRGKGFTDISTSILVLLAFSILFMVLNNLALKKHRKI